MAFEAIGADFIEYFELSPLRAAAGAEIIFLLEGGLVLFGHCLSEMVDAILDRVDSEMVVDEVVVAMDRPGGILFNFLPLLTGKRVSVRLRRREKKG